MFDAERPASEAVKKLIFKKERFIKQFGLPLAANLRKPRGRIIELCFY